MWENVLGLLPQLAFQGFILEVEPQWSGGWCAGDPVSLLVDWQRFSCWLTVMWVVLGQDFKLVLNELTVLGPGVMVLLFGDGRWWSGFGFVSKVDDCSYCGKYGGGECVWWGRWWCGGGGEGWSGGGL